MTWRPLLYVLAAFGTAVVLLALAIVMGDGRKRALEQAADEAARQRGRDIAYRIRAELVCCHLYERVQAGEVPHSAVRGSGHDLCYWGEAAAQLAEGRCPGYPTVPNVCQCDCAGCPSGCDHHVEASAALHTNKHQDGDQT